MGLCVLKLFARSNRRASPGALRRRAIWAAALPTPAGSAASKARLRRRGRAAVTRDQCSCEGPLDSRWGPHNWSDTVRISLARIHDASQKAETRVVLLEELWNYHTHLVDIHMWQLRRNVDRPRQSPMMSVADDLQRTRRVLSSMRLLEFRPHNRIRRTAPPRLLRFCRRTPPIRISSERRMPVKRGRP
jgi:hypothetical protein